MRKPLSISMVQFDIVWEDMELNLRKIEALMNANNFQADIIILPEMFNTGFSMHPERIASDETNGRVVNWMKALALNKQATIVGSIAYHEDGRYFNRLMAVTSSGTVTHYNKRHLFRMADEHEVYERGDERVIVEVGTWRIALFVCYDLRFPVWSRNLNQYDMAIYVANWPHKRREVWQTLLKARAIENQCFVVGVNRIGKDPSEYYSGHTAIIDFQGQVLKVAPENEEAVVNSTVDLNNLEAFKASFPVWLDADSFEIKSAQNPANFFRE